MERGFHSRQSYRPRLVLLLQEGKIFPSHCLRLYGAGIIRRKKISHATKSVWYLRAMRGHLAANMNGTSQNNRGFHADQI